MILLTHARLDWLIKALIMNYLKPAVLSFIKGIRMYQVTSRFLIK